VIFGALPASAQDYGPPGNDTYANPPERVEVTRPRVHVRVGHFGQVERVTTSRELQMSDSELRTPEGAHALRMQVHEAAGDICSELKYHVRYSLESWHSCYHDAVAHGMRNANWAIEKARYEGE
jgi:UrcA family protein